MVGGSEKHQYTQMGRRLTAVRLALGLKLRDFSNYGIEVSRMSNWEQGERPPNAVALIPFCERFDVPLDYIFRGKVGSLPADLRERVDEILSQTQTDEPIRVRALATK
jgi:transcriptional regulator with XRE-family HTH domain